MPRSEKQWVTDAFCDNWINYSKHKSRNKIALTNEVIIWGENHDFTSNLYIFGSHRCHEENYRHLKMISWIVMAIKMNDYIRTIHHPACRMVDYYYTFWWAIVTFICVVLLRIGNRYIMQLACDGYGWFSQFFLKRTLMIISKHPLMMLNN